MACYGIHIHYINSYDFDHSSYPFDFQLNIPKCLSYPQHAINTDMLESLLLILPGPHLVLDVSACLETACKGEYLLLFFKVTFSNVFSL